jgi:hypothetical protein
VALASSQVAIDNPLQDSQRECEASTSHTEGKKCDGLSVCYVLVDFHSLLVELLADVGAVVGDVQPFTNLSVELLLAGVVLVDVILE